MQDACRTLSEPNGTKAEHLSAEERLTEVAEILAAGLLRLRSETVRGGAGDCGERPLDYSRDQSGPVLPKRAGARR
jgi:hypothetical protein